MWCSTVFCFIAAKSKEIYLQAKYGSVGHCPGSVTSGASGLLGTFSVSWFTSASSRSLMQSLNYKGGLSPRGSELWREGFRAALLFPVFALQGGTWTCWQEFTGGLQIGRVGFENEPYHGRFKEVSLHVLMVWRWPWLPSEVLWNGKILADVVQFLTCQAVIFGSWSESISAWNQDLALLWKGDWSLSESLRAGGQPFPSHSSQRLALANVHSSDYTQQPKAGVWKTLIVLP